MKKSGYVFDGRIDLNLRMWINIDSNEEGMCTAYSFSQKLTTCLNSFHYDFFSF